MDAVEVLMGLRAIGADELVGHSRRKAVALRAAFDRLAPLDLGSDFEAFVASVPPSILLTYFGSDGLDQHYTRMLGGIAAGRDTFDAVAASITNVMLQQMLYQGRFLMKPVPISEAFIAIDPWYEVGVALGNAKGIETLALGAPFELEGSDRARIDCLATNARELLWGTVESLGEFMRSVPRDVGCLAWYDIDHSSSSDRFNAMCVEVEPALSADTFYMFTGDADLVCDIHEQIARSHERAELHQKLYPYSNRGASQLRSILVASKIVGRLAITLAPTAISYRYLDRTAVEKGKGDGVSSFAAAPVETVFVRPPRSVSSSAPLLNRQIETIVNDVQIGHDIYRLEGGRVIHAVDLHSINYIIVSKADQIIEPAHYPLLLENGSYGKPDATGHVHSSRRSIMHVDGPALLFAFSPEIVAYHSHFLLQCLPNALIAEMIEEKNLKLLVSSSLRKYQLRMLEMLGWGPDRIVTLNKCYDYVCETLYVPAVLPAIFTKTAAPVYDRLIDCVEHVSVDPEKRIIISRAARTTWRNLVNYDAVCDLLVAELGFEVVEPDKLTIEDEIRLFRSSSIVVGAEGAGLYNCCFMSPGTDVVVLADQDYVMYVVGSMAEIRDFDVAFVFGESFQATRDLDRRAGHSDFVVDPLRVLATVQRVIAGREKGR